MQWLQEEIIFFTNTIRKQVFSTKQEFSIIAQCLLTTMEHIQELRQVGMDLTFLLDDIINEDTISAIQTYSVECRRKIKVAVGNDAFSVAEKKPQNLEGLDQSMVQ